MMQTRCTACGTTFRITAEQLKLRQGRVRCGRCHFVFNALEALVVDEAQPAGGEPQNGKASRPAAPPPRPAMPVPPASAPQLAAIPAPAPGRAAGNGSAKNESANAALKQPASPEKAAKAAAAPPPPAVVQATPPSPATAVVPPEFAPVAKPSNGNGNGKGNGNGNGRSRDSTIAKKADAAAMPVPPPEAAPASASADLTPPPAPKWTASDGDFALTSIDEIVYATDTPRAAGDHEFELPEIKPLVIPHTMAEPEPILHEAPRRRRSWPWTLGSILALQALVMQAVYVYRVDLTVLQPDLRPLLADACAQIGCDLPLPQQIKLIDIEASDLNPDPAARNHLRLSATLKNRAPFAQQLPDVELTLTDTLDRPLASRVLTPADYLPAKRSAAAGFAAGEDLSFSLPIEVVGAAASGYRLYLFYP
jgi:predicted Zn finger-like uncharacterized protein